MLHIVHFSYVPNTASTNRLLSYLNNIPSHIIVKLYFLMPDSKRSEVECLPENIQVIYCWKKYNAKLKIIAPITYRLSLRYVKRQLKKGDVVYVYNIPHYINNLFKSGVRYYGERTESPEVTTSPSRLIPFTLKKHLTLCRKLDGIFVISTALREYYVSNGVSEDKIHIINMTVDSIRFCNLSKEKCQHRYIAYCGSFANTKDGLDKLLRSFAVVSKDIPDIYLYIIGPGSADEENANSHLVEMLGIQEKVIFTGPVLAKDMPQLLKNAEVCALARPDTLQSKCGFPTKLGEYLLTKNPVVLTDVGDISLFLEDNVSALISSPDNDDEFAYKLKWVLSNPLQAREVGKKGYEAALTHFNAKYEVEKLLKYMRL